MGTYPGCKTPLTPDEAVVVDAGNVVEGLGVGGLRRVCRVVWWSLSVMLQWLDVRKQGRRGAVSANYVSKWLTWIMHCNYTVLKKNL
jgi:hypothetical protein